ncbi:unnamed protein product [Schistosoma margrebowiei]|uniref:Uncharacterized protein n=1 Tax=Schistosoma margrebowiei TaxID=48269 RepID=A0A183MHJ4_9TREM|nr:unnamed protein product [Schistosoma margrebowiei]
MRISTHIYMMRLYMTIIGSDRLLLKIISYRSNLVTILWFKRIPIGM